MSAVVQLPVSIRYTVPIHVDVSSSCVGIHGSSFLTPYVVLSLLL
jgi:hypothetical protein